MSHACTRRALVRHTSMADALVHAAASNKHVLAHACATSGDPRSSSNNAARSCSMREGGETTVDGEDTRLRRVGVPRAGDADADDMRPVCLISASASSSASRSSQMVVTISRWPRAGDATTEAGHAPVRALLPTLYTGRNVEGAIIV